MLRVVARRRLVRHLSLSDSSRSSSAVELRDEDIEEKFIKGKGPGGQKINKTSSCVFLVHKPTGISVKCQETRHLERNRQLARQYLIGKLDDLLNPNTSRNALKYKRIQKRKAKRASRSKAKYHAQTEEAQN